MIRKKYIPKKIQPKNETKIPFQKQVDQNPSVNGCKILIMEEEGKIQTVKKIKTRKARVFIYSGWYFSEDVAYVELGF